MTIRSLQRRLGHVAEYAGVGRCACGAYLPPEVARPPGVVVLEGYDLSRPLSWLVRHATLAESRQLQALLNGWLERSPELATRRGTSHLVLGDDPSTAPILRFYFADEVDTRPRCPRCGAAVEPDCPIKTIILNQPPPPGLDDALQQDSLLAPRVAELVAIWQRRIDAARVSPPGEPTA